MCIGCYNTIRYGTSPTITWNMSFLDYLAEQVANAYTVQGEHWMPKSLPPKSIHIFDDQRTLAEALYRIEHRFVEP